MQVSDSSIQSFRIVPKMTKHVPVARLTEQASNKPSLVVVVYGKPSSLTARSPADSAHTALRFVDSVVLLGGDPVRR